MNTLRLGRILVVSAVVLFGLGCKNKGDSSDGSSTSTPPTTPPSAPTVTSAAPLALNIYSMFDGQKYVTNHKFQENGATTCSSSASSPVVTCTVSLPEFRTWTSNFHFQFAWLASKCNMLTFQPYYYQRSTSPTYLPPEATTATTVDCSRSGQADCFNGAAVAAVTGFPLNRSILYPPDESNLDKVLVATVDVPSAWAQGKLSTNNLWLINDMAASKMGSTILASTVNAALTAITPYYGAYFGQNEDYLANTMVNYKLICRDFHKDLEIYAINIKFVDEDSASETTPAQNHFATWQDLP